MIRRLALVAVFVIAGAGITLLGAEPLREPASSLREVAPSVLAGTVAEPTGPSAVVSTVPVARRGRPLAIPPEPMPDPAPPASTVGPGFDGRGLIVVARGGAMLATDPGGVPVQRVREGLLFAGLSRQGDWVEVLTPCDEIGWLSAAEIAAVPTLDAKSPPMDLADAVVVLDPGHGGPRNTGAVSPGGELVEKDVNLDIARRARDLFSGSRAVDWDTGDLYEGTDLPAAGRVIVTRVGDDADYEAGLRYRAALADAAGAHVVVSIHNNAGWEVRLEMPGSDVFYQSESPASRRLAELLAEEFQLAFERFDADWVGAVTVGAKSRLSPQDGTSQLYGILRRTSAPAVIAEGAYIANASEAELLATAEFRQAYAAAVYRAVVRFLTTEDRPGGSTDPEVWAAGAGSGDATAACTVPSQPDVATP